MTDNPTRFLSTAEGMIRSAWWEHPLAVLLRDWPEEAESLADLGGYEPTPELKDAIDGVLRVCRELSEKYQGANLH